MGPKNSRARVGEDTGKVGNYFTSEKTHLDFISSGCQLLDLVLGGGYAVRRVSNVVGDNSTGKSLLAIEACANMAHKYPEGDIWYHEVESAFDTAYAETLGMPVDKISFVRDIHKEYDTVEGWFAFMENKVLTRKSKHPGLYILDTQDYLSDNAEKGRDIGKGTFGQDKNQQLNRLYRQHIRAIEASNIHLMVISQTRENIGATFGRKWRVTGEGSLKFAASQRIQLVERGKMKATYRSLEKVYGLNIAANCFKNKVGLAHRTCEFPLYFGFGIDSNEASLRWLKQVKALDELGIGEGLTYKDVQELDKSALEKLCTTELTMQNPKTETRSRMKELLCEHWELTPKGRKKSPGGIDALCESLRETKDPEMEKKIFDLVAKTWAEIEEHFLPKRSKY